MQLRTGGKRQLLGLGLAAMVALAAPAAAQEEETTAALRPPDTASPLHSPAPRFLPGLDALRTRIAAQPLDEGLWRQALPLLVDWLLWQEHLPLETVKTEVGQWLALNRSLENRTPTTAPVMQGIAAIYLLNNERAN